MGEGEGEPERAKRTADDWFAAGGRCLSLAASADSASDRRSDLEEAAEAFEQAARLRPQFAAAWSELGRTRAALGQMPEAAGALATATLRNPGDVESWFHLAQVWLALGRHPEAIASSEEALQRCPGDPEMLFVQARAWEALDRGEWALAAYRRAVRAASGAAPVRTCRHELFPSRGLESAFRRAGVLSRLGRRQEALRAFRAAFRLMPWKGTPAAYRSASWFHDLLAGCEEARIAFEAAVDREPDPANAWVRAADAMLCARRGEEALRFSQAAIDGDPGRELAWFRKAEALVLLGRREEAVAAYRESLRRKPGWLAARARLRVVLGELGRAEEAEGEPG